QTPAAPVLPVAAPPSNAPAASPTAAAPAPKPVNPNDVVLTIGNETLTRERFESLLRAVPPAFQQQAAQMGKKQFANQYAMLLGLARTAEIEKMDQSQLAKGQLAFVLLQFLAQIAFQQ